MNHQQQRRRTTTTIGGGRASSLLIPLLFVGLFLLLFPYSFTVAASSSMSCRVTLEDGTDATDEYFFVDETENDDDDNNSHYVVDCVGSSKCRNVDIRCDSGESHGNNNVTIRCHGSESCNSASISIVGGDVVGDNNDINDAAAFFVVECHGIHACHRTDITTVSKENEDEEEKPPATRPGSIVDTYVDCLGSGACDVTQITGKVQKVTFDGPKAGRKVFVEHADVVECRNGTDRTKACDSFATLNTKCLFCDPNHGCADHINTCRYRMISDDDTDEDALEQKTKYDKCHPGTLLGGDSCPIELRNEFAKTINDDEEPEAEAKSAAATAPLLESVETITDNSSTGGGGGSVMIEEINEVVVSKKKKNHTSSSDNNNGNDDDDFDEVDVEEDKNDNNNDEEGNNKRRLFLRYNNRRRRLS